MDSLERVEQKLNWLRWFLTKPKMQLRFETDGPLQYYVPYTPEHSPEPPWPIDMETK